MIYSCINTKYLFSEWPSNQMCLRLATTSSVICSSYRYISLIVICRRQHKKAISRRIVKPSGALERYLRDDLGLRQGIRSASAQWHFLEQSLDASKMTQTYAASSGEDRSNRAVQLPDIYEATDVPWLDQHLYDCCSTRISIQNKLHRSMHLAACCLRIINDGPKRIILFRRFTSYIENMCHHVDSSRLWRVLDYIFI